jgi:2Fe-2S ferredoxin
MSTITIVGRDGRESRAHATVGVSLMEAIRESVEGSFALCGGCCACGTCHVYVDGAFLERLPALSESETDLLESLSGKQSNSRLSCQIVYEPALAGIKVWVAPEE